MYNLVKNEHIKLLAKTMTWVGFALMFFIVVVVAVFSKWMFDQQMASVLDFMYAAAQFNTFISFMAIGFASTIVANEFSSGTIKLLLIRPISRTKILVSKFVTVQLVGFYLLIVTYVTSFLFGALFFGFGDVTQSGMTVAHLAVDYIAAYVEILLISSFAFMVSVVFRNSAIAIGLGIIAMVGSKVLTEVMSLLENTYGKYLLFSNTSIDQYFFGSQPPFSGMTLLFSIIVLLFHFICFQGIAWFFFSKKDVAV